jgi:protein-S-isoprenylcysteine O-methyltransferase Ste14
VSNVDELEVKTATSKQGDVAASANFTPLVLFPWAHGKKGERLPANWGLSVWGLAFVIAAILVETPAISDLLAQLAWTDAHSSVFNQKTLASLSKEVGFALLIAFFISTGIERQARERHERVEREARESEAEAVSAARAEIARDVFHGVFGLQHDRGYVNTVIEHILQRPVVRENYSVEMTVSRLTKAEMALLKVGPKQFVKVHSVCEYSFLNISTKEATFDVNFILPVRAGQRLRDFARVNTVRLDGIELPEAEITEAEQEPNGAPTKVYCWPRTLPKDGRISVLVSSTILKELSDNEVWRNMHPTIGGAEFKLRMEVPDMEVGIRNITAAKLIDRYAGLPGGESAWTIDGPILPNESIVLWWQTAADSGLDAAPQPSAKPPAAAKM